jgi:transcriptional regulator with XRE-family HTH domain
MKQPDIGTKVAELRLQKCLTQEKLAEMCEVSTRTIQRIESGEVDPRAFTLTNLSSILGYDFGEENNKNETFWLAALHLSSIISIVPIPLFIWTIKKNQSNNIDLHGKAVLNFQIMITIILFSIVILLGLLYPILIILLNHYNIGFKTLFGISLLGFIPLITIGPICFYQGVANTIRVLNNKDVKYSFSFTFIK